MHITTMMHPITPLMIRHACGRLSTWENRVEKNPNSGNHTADAISAPAANTHRPDSPCWFAIPPNMTSVSI